MPRIVTLTANPAIDVSTSTPRMEPAAKLRCAAERRDPGGGGINVARVVRRLGGEALAVYPAGGVIGRLLCERLEAEGLPSLTVEIAGETRENFTVLETASGREFRFVLPGPRLIYAEWRALVEATASAGADFLVVSGGLPPGAPDDLPARAAARAGAAKVVLDVSGPALAAGLKAGVFLAKPNLRELRELTGEALDDEAGRIDAARAIIARGGAQVLALTMGAEGALLVTAERAWRAAAAPIRPLSSVGAGDSFMGGMVWALAEGMPLEDAFRHAMASASAALLSPGTQLGQAADVRRLLPLVEISEV